MFWPCRWLSNALTTEILVEYWSDTFRTDYLHSDEPSLTLSLCVRRQARARCIAVHAHALTFITRNASTCALSSGKAKPIGIVNTGSRTYRVCTRYTYIKCIHMYADYGRERNVSIDRRQSTTRVARTRVRRAPRIGCQSQNRVLGRKTDERCSFDGSTSTSEVDECAMSAQNVT